MINFRSFWVFVVSMFFSTLSAKEYTETLSSRANDRITISYSVTIRDGEASVSFTRVHKQLGMKLREKYDHPENVKVVFFDRNGNYRQDRFISDINTETPSINLDELSYTPSEEGYVWIDDQLKLRIKLHVSETSMSIPVYLAYYKKKHTYDIIAYCGNLTIPLSQSQHQNGKENGKKTITRTLTTEEEVEVCDDLSSSEIVILLINRINSSLSTCEGTTLPDGLEDDVRMLRENAFGIKDKKLQSKIDEVLLRVSEKKREIEQEANLSAKTEAEKANLAAIEQEARTNLEYLQERLASKEKLSESDMADLKAIANDLRRKSHSVKDHELAEQMNKAADQCDDEMKKIEDANKKKSVWMVIGGFLFVVLMFVGNHTLQYFRNLRNQKGIEEMQNRLAKNAENEARRRAHNAVGSKINRLQNAAIDKSRQTINGGIKNGIKQGIKGKEKNSITI